VVSTFRLCSISGSKKFLKTGIYRQVCQISISHIISINSMGGVILRDTQNTLMLERIARVIL